jgi:secreted trypsin-like serine protease
MVIIRNYRQVTLALCICINITFRVVQINAARSIHHHDETVNDYNNNNNTYNRFDDITENESPDIDRQLQTDNSTVVGGIPVYTNKYPFYVRLLNIFGGSCGGGTLISHNLVLTSASAVLGCLSTTVVVGARTTMTDNKDFGEEIEIKARLPHPWFDDDPFEDNNLGIIKLNCSTRNKFVKLNGRSSIPQPLTDVVIAGFGIPRADDDDSTAITLRQATVKSYANTDCKSNISDSFNGINWTCAGGNMVSTSTGDGGGPLLLADDVFTLVGVANYRLRFPPYERPVVFTRVSHYIRWIRRMVDYHSKGTPTYCN